MPIIETKNLTYIYGQGTPFEKVAVEDVSISIEKGEFVGVIGHTGSGKSTLIQTLNGLIRPTSGQVLLDGKDIWAEPKKIRSVRFRVGMVFQYPEYQLFEETVLKDIMFGPKNMGLSDDEARARAYEAARFTDLKEELLEKSPFELSGGEKRRAAIAGVIAMDPEVLILDEPTAGLDPRGRDVLLSQIGQYHRERGNTVLLVSHSMEDIGRTADRLLVMSGGHKQYLAPTREVFSHGEELEKMGLRVPQITKIMQELIKLGVPADPATLTVEGAVKQLIPYFKKRGDEENAV
ncbi:energy-coupling factor transporter ATPase [Acutalibacter muris]|jgi:energy-coupling factor transport system ATP-binding protein|uniref:Energy-coupling factor transporter ATP-binding protein EcfA2 n=1 Tax=Acutalibacter muris TaxID=1796620 RepID=A0A1Z2XV46_9FIRM|nr:energy-coupling factor transporter ATPase [Acutalibacter muris]ANU54469.1 energy-coupling factor transporter ATPase [Hungateiclostridiaceae bacterium KB18]ASB42310.1 energy-coupling factor transporter ATPase [Acutalibacter muris]QQR31590.1 energy-coupling factor transporter ATPase [Acutalibacter muris]